MKELKLSRQKLKVGKSISFSENEYDLLKGADALVICTKWGLFRNPNFDKIKGLMKDPVIFDGRNQYIAFNLEETGFEY